MYIHTHTHTHVHGHVRIHIHTHVQIHIRIHTRIHIRATSMGIALTRACAQTIRVQRPRHSGPDIAIYTCVCMYAYHAHASSSTRRPTHRKVQGLVHVQILCTCTTLNAAAERQAGSGRGKRRSCRGGERAPSPCRVIDGAGSTDSGSRDIVRRTLAETPGSIHRMELEWGVWGARMLQLPRTVRRHLGCIPSFHQPSSRL